MTSRRVLKAAEAIREVVSMAILVELRDPRIQLVTVTRVEVSADLRNAKVYVSVMGDESQQQLALHGLRHSAGFLQHKLSDRINTRYTPRLRFVLDQGVKKSAEVHRILGELFDDEEPDDPLDASDDSLDEVEPGSSAPADPSAADGSPDAFLPDPPDRG